MEASVLGARLMVSLEDLAVVLASMAMDKREADRHKVRVPAEEWAILAVVTRVVTVAEDAATVVLVVVELVAQAVIKPNRLVLTAGPVIIRTLVGACNAMVLVVAVPNTVELQAKADATQAMEASLVPKALQRQILEVVAVGSMLTAQVTKLTGMQRMMVAVVSSLLHGKSWLVAASASLIYCKSHSSIFK